jgi:UDPglucose 6-dehydrogenase/GDP-mannose 6-dehydrogenase
MRVSIIGAGYVGLVTGACLADKGLQVACVDIDPDRVRQINAGRTPIHEDGLGPLLQRHAGHNLTATTDLAGAVRASDLTMIAVGTPLRDGQIDLTYVREAARQVGEAVADHDGYHVTVVKSTVVPGTTDRVVIPALEEASGKRVGSDLGVGTNPEFLTEGQAVRDFMSPDRIVIGGVDERTVAVIDRLYEGFGHTPRILTNNATAELIKYTSNALLATMISFSNEIANLATALGGIDVVDVMRGVHTSHYLSPRGPDGQRIPAPITSFLEAGCGFGGSCLPKDVGALIRHGQDAGQPMRVLDAVLRTNVEQPGRLITVLRERLGPLRDRRVTVLGLAFKPDTDDVRESPAFGVIRQLLAQHATVTAYDPVANRAAQRALPDADISFADDLKQAVAEADAIVIITRWEQFQAVPAIIATADPQPLVVDGRRMLDPRSVNRYAGIGLGAELDTPRSRREVDLDDPQAGPERSQQ